MFLVLASPQCLLLSAARGCPAANTDCSGPAVRPNRSHAWPGLPPASSHEPHCDGSDRAAGRGFAAGTANPKAGVTERGAMSQPRTTGSCLARSPSPRRTSVRVEETSGVGRSTATAVLLIGDIVYRNLKVQPMASGVSVGASLRQFSNERNGPVGVRCSSPGLAISHCRPTGAKAATSPTA